MPRQRTDRGELEQGHRRDLHLQLAAELGNKLQCEQGITSQIEELIVHADLFGPQDPLPNGGNRLFVRATRSRVSCTYNPPGGTGVSRLRALHFLQEVLSSK